MRASGVERVYGVAGDSDVARGIGLHGVRVERPEELDGALRDAFAHAGPALIDIVTARQELSMPPKLTFEQIKGFTLYATRTILSGWADEIVELARTNVRDVGHE